MNEKRNTEDGGKKERKKRRHYGIYFLGCVIFVYFFLFLFKPESIQRSLKASGDLFIKIIPVVFFIIFLMGVVNYFVNPKAISKYVGRKSGIKGWLLAISTGILSHGSIYLWYPLLKELRNQGMRSGLVAVFLYNRAIKIPLLPLMIYYFGITFVVVLLIYMIIASIVEGKIMEMMLKTS